MRRRLNQWIDDVTWGIKLFIYRTERENGIVANLIIPSIVAFITAILTAALFKNP